MTGKPFIAVTITPLQSSIRKYRPLANDTWDVWVWASGWSLLGNVSDAEAQRAIQEADEVFFEQEPADGWIEWHGGDNPFTTNTLLDVKSKAGTSVRVWSESMKWWHTDIIAYRVVQP